MIIGTPLWFKKLTVPFTNWTRQVEAVQLWEVRWRSRHGQYCSDTQPEVEVFTSPEDAHAFADSLRNAFRLIRHSDGDTITIARARGAGPNLRLMKVG